MTQEKINMENISDKDLAKAGQEIIEEKDRTLTLEEMKTIKTSSGYDKPIFDKNTKAVVEQVEAKVSNKTSTDSNGKPFTPIYLQVKCVVGDAITVDNLGGLRYYTADDRYWVGEKSDFGKLKQKVSDILGNDDPMLSEIKELLEGREVQIKTETRSFQGNESQKNIIQAIL